MKDTDQRSPLRSTYDGFLLSLEAAQRSSGTLRYYRDKLGGFVAWCEGQAVTTMNGITPDLIRRYMLARKAEVSALTLHHNLACVRAWCNWAVDEGLLAVSPMRRITLPYVEERILPAFSADEAKRLVKVATTARNRAIVLMLLDTGLRASELCALNVDDVDLVSGTVFVRHAKTRRQRTVYVGARTRRALTQYLAQHPANVDALWLSRDARLTVNGLHMALRRLGVAAKVKNCHAHTFRRTFALWSLRAGMNIYVLQRLMGHRSLTILQRYLDLVQTDLAAAHRACGAVDRLFG